MEYDNFLKYKINCIYYRLGKDSIVHGMKMIKYCAISVSVLRGNSIIYQNFEYNELLLQQQPLYTHFRVLIVYFFS